MYVTFIATEYSKNESVTNLLLNYRICHQEGVRTYEIIQFIRRLHIVILLLVVVYEQSFKFVSIAIKVYQFYRLASLMTTYTDGVAHEVSVTEDRIAT